MYCPYCGASGQTGRFCAHCGREVNAAPAISPPAPVPQSKNEVNVTVNVGGPSIVQPVRAQTLGERAVNSAISAFQASKKAKRDAALHQQELRKLHASTLAVLNACHDLIQDIESSVVLELLPSESVARAIYTRGLELRSQAAELLTPPITEEALHRAHSLALQATQDLQTAKQSSRRTLP
jgi:hypothetical protein